MAELPKGWEKRESQSRGRPYYYNVETHESRWEPPANVESGQASYGLKLFTCIIYVHVASYARRYRPLTFL